MATARPRRVILMGMMGSGKSAVGRLLAAATGWPYVDNDELLATAAGRTAREMAEASEPELRTAESAALRAGLATPEPCIVGAAAGTILDATNRTAMANAGIVVWLRARPATLARRAVGTSHRPWLERSTLAWMRETIAERAPLYASIADLTIDVDRLRPAAVSARILDQLVEARIIASRVGVVGVP